MLAGIPLQTSIFFAGLLTLFSSRLDIGQASSAL
jgi:hypothetical protein